MIHFLLCGGSGTRLWPISRKNFPKQFCHLVGDKSLFQDTYLRNLEACGRHVVMANRENYFMAMNQIDELHLEVAQSTRFLLEPIGRNTAPAIALACFMVGEDDVALVTPADHLIDDMDQYRLALQRAKEEAEKGYLVCFGIKAGYPEEGYGYIEAKDGSRDNDSAGALDVLSFKEKPDRETAEDYIRKGNFYWNSGMFCFRAGVFLSELKQHAPQIYERSKAAFENNTHERGIYHIDLEDMLNIPKDSIDYAVMEKSKRVKVVPSSFGWNDIGSYDALVGEFPMDQSGNTVLDNHINVDSKNNLILSNRAIATVDVNDLIIVDTPDALMIARKGSSQKVQRVVSLLKDKAQKEKCYEKLIQEHTTVYRPWGSYTVLEERDRYKMKRIEVRPGKRLSLQKHFHRSEHWVIVGGESIVTKGENEYHLKVNESIYIPVGEFHRLENPGKVDLVLLEIQVGDYLEEDDIVRIEDDFDRC